MTETEPSSPAPASPPRPWWRRALTAALRLPTLVLVTLYFLLDDVVLAALRPVVARLAELRPFVRIAAAIERLPPYPTLVLFLVPFAVLEPFKLWGLVLVATGHLVAGTTMLALSHLASIVLVERLFHATRAKLLTIGWFARLYGWVMVLYDWSVGRLRATPLWRGMAAALTELRVALRAIAAMVRRRFGPVAERLRIVLRARFADGFARLRRALDR